jgi:hypothetical protein
MKLRAHTLRRVMTIGRGCVCVASVASLSVRAGAPERRVPVSLKSPDHARRRELMLGAAGKRAHVHVAPVALALLLGRRGRRTCRCPLPAEGDMRAPNEGAGFDPLRSLAKPKSRTAASP